MSVILSKTTYMSVILSKAIYISVILSKKEENLHVSDPE